MQDIKRIDTDAKRSRVVIVNGFVWLGGQTADDRGQDIRGQTAQTLAKIDRFLNQAGTDKSRIVSAQIWLKDIERDLSAFNEMWEAWVPSGQAPARAACQVKLAASDILLEMIVMAALA